MRDDVLTDLVDKAVNDPDFRSKAKDDLEGTLKAYNFDLTEDELAAVRDFHSQAAGKSDEELDEMLSDSSRKQFSPI